MKEQYIYITSDVFDNALIEESSDHIHIFNFDKRVSFTEKLPSRIKKINLYIKSVSTSVIGIFDDIETLHLGHYFHEIVEILKTNTKLEEFSCQFYDSINLDELPRSITSIKSYQRNYCGSFDRITALQFSPNKSPKLSDILPFVNLKLFEINIHLDENVYYDNSKIELIGFQTKNNFHLKLPNVKDLKLYVYFDNAKDLNDNFQFLFENCPNIEKMYMVLYSEIKIEEQIIINNNIKDFTLNLMHSELNNFNIIINGVKNNGDERWCNGQFKNNGHKRWCNGVWAYSEVYDHWKLVQSNGRMMRANRSETYKNFDIVDRKLVDIVDRKLQQINSHELIIIDEKPLPHNLPILKRLQESIVKTEQLTFNTASSYESMGIETDTNQLTASIKFDREYSSLKLHSEEYILVLRIRNNRLTQNILLKMFDILLRRAQTLIRDKNDEMDFRAEYYIIVLENLYRFTYDVEARYMHYGLLTEEIFKEFGFLSMSSVAEKFANFGRLMDEYDAFTEAQMQMKLCSSSMIGIISATSNDYFYHR